MFVFMDDSRRKQTEAALKDSEELYRSLVEMMPDTMMLFQNDRLVYANPPAFQLLAPYQPDELIGSKMLDLVHPENRETVMGRIEKLDRLYHQNPPARITLLSLDGQPHEVEIASKQIKYQGGTAILSTGRDITEHLEAEKALVASEKRLRSILENLRMAALILDADGRVSFCNDYLPICWAMHRIVSWVIYGSIIFCRQYADQIKKIFEQAIGCGKLTHYVENSILCANGDERMIAWHNTPLMDTDGNIISVASIGQDVTERRAAELALKASEEKFRSLAEHSGAGITYFDLKGKILFINEQAAEYYDASPADCLGCSVESLGNGANGLCSLQRIQSTVNAERHLTFEDQIKTAKGMRSIISDYTKVKDDAGRISGVQIINRDITSLRQMQQKLADNEEFLQAVFDNSGVGIFVIDVNQDGTYRLVRMNSEVKKYLGVSSQEAMSGKMEILAPVLGGERLQEVKRQYDECVRTQQPAQYEHSIEVNGKRDWWLRDLVPLVDSSGRVYRIIGSATPITGLRQAEQDRERLKPS